MEFKNHSIDTVAELLVYLADHEDFHSLKGFTNLTKQDAKRIFKELAGQLKELADNQPLIDRNLVAKSDLTDNLHKVVAKLSPQEENILFKSFRIS